MQVQGFIKQALRVLTTAVCTMHYVSHAKPLLLYELLRCTPWPAALSLVQCWCGCGAGWSHSSLLTCILVTACTRVTLHASRSSVMSCWASLVLLSAKGTQLKSGRQVSTVMLAWCMLQLPFSPVKPLTGCTAAAHRLVMLVRCGGPCGHGWHNCLHSCGDRVPMQYCQQLTCDCPTESYKMNAF